MYKLFLCLTYVRKRAMAWFAMVAVALSVFMMLVTVSVLNGFVEKIERAAKGLFGDIVISSGSLGGVAYYDEFAREIRRDIPAVEGASPFILTFGILRVPGTDYRRTVQIAGIRLPGRADVSDFEEGLFVQEGVREPTFDPPVDLVARRLGEHYRETKDILARIAAPKPGAAAGARLWRHWAGHLGLLSLVLIACTIAWIAWDASRNEVGTGSGAYSSDAVFWILAGVLFWAVTFPYYLVKRHRELAGREGERQRLWRTTLLGLGVFVVTVGCAAGNLAALAAGQEPAEDPSQPDRLRNAMSYQEMGLANIRLADLNRRDLAHLNQLLQAADANGDDLEVRLLERRIDMLRRRVLLPPDKRAILGLGIPGLTHRTRRGETIRTIGPGHQVVLSLIPLGRRLSYADITPSTERFSVIDDCSTDVSSIDSEIAYVPFETLQLLNNMSAEVAADDPNIVVERPRCSQIHVKVTPALSRGRALAEVCGQIDGAWQRFARTHPDAARGTVHVETWRQRQSRLVSSIEAQRTLMVMILSIVSFVAVVLIFVIMYVIVVQKTRDIGVLKAVGASGPGVAGIFLVYGGAIGLLGSIVGTAGGVAFVRNINPIHDWIGRAFGFVVWNRETFMFEKIPNEIQPGTVTAIVIAAVVGGILGALLPALLAACKQPVEALRYE